MSGNANNPEKQKKLKLMIIAIVAGAALILGIALLYVVPYIREMQNKEELEKLAKEQGEQFAKSQAESADQTRAKIYQDLENLQKDQSAEDIAESSKASADETREEMSKNTPGIYGTYIAGGDIDYSSDAWSFKSIELKDDFTATVVTAYDGIGKKAWWTCEKYEGVYIVKLAVEGKEDVELYQVYNSHLVNMNSIYIGTFEDTERFDSEFVIGDSKGKMTISLSSDGSAEGEFVDTNPESENNGTTFAMSGDYFVDGEFIDITLNTATTRFLKLRFDTESQGEVSGIASMFFTKK
ncbi:MAG: hypothetical protein IJB70_12160 [Clostridia bacterium]|nr:hypothetical protein [Clostridia bacterium]